MTLQRSVILAALLGAAAFLASSLLAADRVVVQPLPVPPLSELARPCLIDTTGCLDLSSTPFAPCLIAASRCSPEWHVVPLHSLEPARAGH
jgi:hypothetical protein